MSKKIVSTLLILTLLSSIMGSIFFGTLQVAKADTQSSDSNGDPNSWLMFHSDLSHTGYSTSTTPLTGAPLWTYPTAGVVISSPAVANGMVYVGLTNGNVTALVAATGAYIWNFTTGNSVYSSPAVAGGLVYVGSLDGNVYALNATTGNKLWNYSTGGQIWSSPSVANNIVYIGSQSGNVYALNATTGSKIWSYTAGLVALSSPAVANGMVYIGSTNGNVTALDATSGAYIWNYTTGNQVWSSPAVANGIVYVGSFDGNVYALNAATGSKIWNFTTNGMVYSSPAVFSGIVYIGSIDTNVYALNAATGNKIWNFTMDNVVISSPIVANNLVYFGSGNGNMYALNAATGTKTWSYSTYNGIISSPAIANGIVYVGSYDGHVYAFSSLGHLSTTTSVSCPQNPILAGSTVTCNASISGSNPIGTVSWSTNSSTGIFYPSTTSLNSGSTTTTFTDTSPGTVTITATYNGDANNAISNENTTLTLNGFVVSGYVLAPNGTGIQNVGVNFNNGTLGRSSSTNSSGYYSVAIPAGTYSVSVYNLPSGSNLLNYQESGLVVSGNLVHNITLQTGLIVSGYVLAPNGTNVANTRVNIYNNTWSSNYWTGTSGYYSLAVPVGTFSIYAYPPSGSNLLSYSESGLVVSNNLVHNITLQTGFVVSGYVLAPNGTGVPSAEVYFANGPWFSNTWSTDIFTDMSGHYSVIVPADTYEMSVYNLPFGTDLLNYFESGIVVYGDMVHNVTIQSGLILSGYVSAPNGTVVSNVEVQFNNGTWGRSLSTNASGYYSVAVPAGTFSVAAYPPSGSNLLDYQESGLVVSGNLVHNITLQTGFIVSGYVLAPNGTVVSNVGVSLGSDTYYESASADVSGYYSLAVPAGIYSVNVYNLPSGSNLVGYPESGLAVSGNLVHNITLQTGFIVSGYILAPNGTPVPNVAVNFYNNSWSTWTGTNVAGYYSIAAPSGTFSISAYPSSDNNLMNYQESGLVVSNNLVHNITLQTGFVISGYVTSLNGTAIVNANIYIYNSTWSYNSWTGMSGYFSFAIPPGTYTFNVFSPLAYLQSYSQSNFVLSRSFAINVTLRENRTMSGYVLSPNGTGVSGVTVNAFPIPSGTSKSTTTNASGYYSLTITEGIYTFSFIPPVSSALLSYSEPYDLVNSNLVKNVTLSKGYLFSGYILAPNGSGVSGSSITLSKTAGTRTVWSAGASTNGSGYYSLVAPLGTFNIFVNPAVASQLSYYNQTGVIVSGNTIKNVTLSSGYKVNGYVLDQLGNPVASAIVYWTSTTGSRSVSTNSSGYYVTYVPAGTFNLLVNPPSGASLAYKVEKGIIVSADLAKNVTLFRGFRISGYVSDQNGNAIGNVGISVPTGVGTYTLSRSADTSGFYSIYVPAGTCNFLVNPLSTTKWVPYNATFEVSSDMNMNVILSSGFLVSGFILDQNGNPVIGATVSFSNSILSRSFIANGSGYYIAYLPAGSFNLFVYSPIAYNLLSYGATGMVVSSNVVINATLSSGPTVLASSKTLYQGQTATLTSTALSTGTSPYTYQWFEKSPGGNYVPVGMNSANFNFATSTSTATGTWNFILQVTDNTGAMVNSTETTVLVNSAVVVKTWYLTGNTVINSVISGDVDNDGNKEIVTGGYYFDGTRTVAQLIVWDGTTLAAKNVASWYWTGNTTINSVAIGDVDGDGQVEIVTGGYYNDGVRNNAQLIEWNGATLAVERLTGWYWTSNTAINSVALGDVDGDGQVEIVTGGYYNDGSRNNAQLIEWNGTNLALDRLSCWCWTGDTVINSVALGDVDNDGQVEVVTGGYYFDGVRNNAQLVEWNGATLAADRITGWYWISNTAINSVAAGDVDGDGLVEIVTGGYYNDGVRNNAQLIEWNGANLALDRLTGWYWTSNTAINSVAISDIDFDGQVEVVTGGFYNDGVRDVAQLTIWLGLNLVAENIKSWYETGNTTINSVAVGDVNGDSLKEIVTGGAFYDGTRLNSQLTVWGMS